MDMGNISLAGRLNNDNSTISRRVALSAHKVTESKWEIICHISAGYILHDKMFTA